MGWTSWRTGRWYPTALRLISIDPGPGAPRRRTGEPSRGGDLGTFSRDRPGPDALFTSDLSARCEHTPIEVATAIRHAIGTHAGIGGCAAEVAAEYGEHPETAARRMRWARAVVDGINADWGAFLGRRTRESL